MRGNDLEPALNCGVILRRTDGDDVQQRQIYVTLDGAETHMLLFGDTLQLDLEPGPHTLKANNTLYWKTVEFTVEAGQTARFMLVNKAGIAALGFLAVLGVGPLALVIRREDVPPAGEN